METKQLLSGREFKGAEATIESQIGPASPEMPLVRRHRGRREAAPCVCCAGRRGFAPEPQGAPLRDAHLGSTAGASPSRHGVSEGLGIVRVHAPRPMIKECQSPDGGVNTFDKLHPVTG